MKQIIIKLTTFDDILKESKQCHASNVFNNLRQWLKLISKYYLSDKEVNILDAMKFYIENNKRQREISILFGEQQSRLRIDLDCVNSKITKLHEILSNPRIYKEYKLAKDYLNSNQVSHSRKQFNTLRYVLAGHSVGVIADHKGVTQSNVYNMLDRITYNLVEFKKCSVISKYLVYYKHRFES